MKVSVLGAGAIGSMLGGLIQHYHPEIEVMLIVRGEHGHTVRGRGIVTLNGYWGSLQVPIRSSFEVQDISGSDFVLLTVKSHASEEAISSAAPYLGNAIVISVQNGINDSILRNYVQPNRLVMGMSATNMAVLEPGAVSLQLAGATVVGPTPDGANAEAAHAAAELLRKSKLRLEEHPNVLGMRYNKLALNALGYVSCLSQSNFITEAVCHRDWRANVGLPLLVECLNIFAVARTQLAKIPGRPTVKRLQRFFRLLDVPLVGRVIAMGARIVYNRKPILFSLYQDLLRGKPTEVDFINGEIVRLAKENDVGAPLNQLAVELCHEAEQHGPASFFTRDEVIKRFHDGA